MDSNPSVFDYLNIDEKAGQTHEQFYNAARMLAEPEREVDHAAYWYFLEVLPPYYVDGGFCVSEPIMDAPNGRVMLSFFRQAGSGETARYFHRYVAVNAVKFHREHG
jgi:hypothetical protein